MNPVRFLAAPRARTFHALLLPLVLSAGVTACGGSAVVFAKDPADAAPDTGSAPSSDEDAGARDARPNPVDALADAGAPDATTAADTASAADTSVAGEDAADAAPATACGAGAACVAVPEGWQAVTLQSGACPAGFGPAMGYYSAVQAAPFACSCACSGTDVCGGTATFNAYAGTGCGGTPTATQITLSTTCVEGAYAEVTGGDSYELTNVSFHAGGGCTGTPTPTAMPQPTTTTMNVCPASGASCAEGSCVPEAGAGTVCVAQPGQTTCPAGFPHATSLSQTFDDTRGCGACSCASGLECTLTGLAVDNDSSCTQGIYSMTVSSACTVASSDFPGNAIQTVATSSGSAACTTTASPSAPAGGVTLDPGSSLTVCCP